MAVFLIATLVCSMPVAGQDTRGTIRGTVWDSSMAAIPNATVMITDVIKATTVKVTTNTAGLYVVPYLIPSTYTVAVEIPGFKKYVRDNIELRVGDTLVVDVELTMGVATETITVSGAASLLETATASTGQVVDAKRIAELPIPHGDPYKLMGLAAGTSFARDPRLDRPYEPTHIAGYVIDGTRANRSDLTIDGAPSTATANRGEVTSTFVPPQDLVQEFKVQTATYDSAFGNTEGGVTAIQIKSGTRDLHGTLGYTNMTPGLFANDFFANQAHIPLADFYYHRFGGTAGGPVVIPKLYNGREKTFWMFGYEGIREARPRNDGVPTTPTLCMLGRATCGGVQQIGNFSELLPLGTNYQIYDPFSATGTVNAFQRSPFAGNIIPLGRINPVAKSMVDKYWPNPTSAGNADGTQNFQQPNMTEHAVYDSYTIRGDHNFTPAHKIFARTSWYQRYSDYNNYFHNLTTGNYFYFISRQGVFDYVWLANPTTILNTHYAYNRFIRGDTANPAGNGFDLTSVGFPQAYAAAIDPAVLHFPRIRFTTSNVYQGTAANGERRPNDTHSAAATLTKIMSNHTVRGGFEFRAYRENDVFFGSNQTGDFLFDNTYTQARNAAGTANIGNTQQIGHAFAAFLLGVPTQGSNQSQVVVPASYAEQSKTWGFFGQDDWKVTRKLTLNIGLRWEFEQPLTERFNKSNRQLNYGFVQPIEAAAQAAYAANPSTPEIAAGQFFVRGGLTFSNVGGNPRGLYDTPKRNLMPRFGFAYSFNDKTVLRGGYGIFYGFLGQRRGDVLQAGFSANTNFNVTTNSGFTFIDTLSNPLGSFSNTLVKPQGSAQGGATFVGQTITAFDPKPHMPYMQRWSLGIQRELPGGFVAEVEYVGNRGTHLDVFSGQSTTTIPNINVTPQRYLSKSPTRDNTTRTYLTQNVANPLAGLMPTGSVVSNGATIARERLLRPFPEFDVVRVDRSDGYSWYHALQAGVQKRMSHGHTINVSYTYSKFMSATELLNDDDLRPWEGISDMDYPHRLAASWIWELPFGKGRAFGSGAKGIVNKIIGDWQMGGYYQLQSGNPVGPWPGSVVFTGDLRSIGKPRDQRTVNSWFNTAGFERNSTLQLDHNVRTFPLRLSWVRSDFINNADLSLLKNIPVNERFKFQFKAEFMNAFNHPWFPTPTAAQLTPTDAGFGQVKASTQRNYPRRTQMALKFIF